MMLQASQIPMMAECSHWQ